MAPVRSLLILLSVSLLANCSLLPGSGSGKKPKKKQVPLEMTGFPTLSYEVIQDRAGGLQPADHLALARWDDEFYYFEWREIVEPATMKTMEGYGRVPVKEFDAKNGRPLERTVGVVGKEDLNGQLYNAGDY